MIIVHRYTVESIDGTAILRIRAYDAPLCPVCGSLCSGYDTRSRRVVGDDGRAVVYRLHRVRCPKCNSLHLEIPYIIRPRKHYAADVIGDALVGCSADCPADESTIRRWRRENYPPGLPVHR